MGRATQGKVGEATMRSLKAAARQWAEGCLPRRTDYVTYWGGGPGRLARHGIVTSNRAERRTGRFVDDVIISGRYELAAHHLDPSCAARKGVQLALAKRQVGWDGFHATDPGFTLAARAGVFQCAPAPTAQVMAGGGQAPHAGCPPRPSARRKPFREPPASGFESPHSQPAWHGLSTACDGNTTSRHALLQTT
ncbi:hypothetical protein PCL_06099 [Purpureocillium lilacinum]|uniref:Uncharacterized protein n=1 Tax=Purpureocillium lilacinum TaxID=33203 RepID=A0A2U3ELQ8_PURLI|nr:hypothetical protein PCL_06099 [Purpureocillium lilacinum]